MKCAPPRLAAAVCHVIAVTYWHSSAGPPAPISARAALFLYCPFTLFVNIQFNFELVFYALHNMTLIFLVCKFEHFVTSFASLLAFDIAIGLLINLLRIIFSVVDETCSIRPKLKYYLELCNQWPCYLNCALDTIAVLFHFTFMFDWVRQQVLLIALNGPYFVCQCYGLLVCYRYQLPWSFSQSYN